MILYIAEKPSLGRAVADVLPKPHTRGDGFITVGTGDVVSWCIGHLLEQAQPEAYNPAFKRWNIEHLPIVPQQWKVEVKPNTKKQFSVLKKLIKQADQLVNIGDPDREGQLLVDEVINHSGVSKAKISATKRCLISDLNPEAVAKSLSQLRNNTDFVPLATSALARSRADWLYGINMTRLCTLQGQRSGFTGVLSIGRVQTPLLGLVVKRDLEIEHFVSKPFYELEVMLQSPHPYSFKAKWKPSAAIEPFMDEENRILDRKVVQQVADKVLNQTGSITKFSSSLKKIPPPLTYNLSALQIDAAIRFGMSAKQVLDVCQTLYEQHKLITYPRSDCRHLPEEHYPQAPQVIQAIDTVLPALNPVVKLSNPSLRSKAWDDKKITAHHAIIPTTKRMQGQRLSAAESNVYECIARQYLMQFLPPFEFQQIDIESTVEKELFTARLRHITALGWKQANPKSPEKKEFEENRAIPPTYKKGDEVRCIEANVLDKKTTPPRHFTDATLLSAMTGIARYVTNQEIRKILRETDGLGTDATRASIIELLFSRDFLHRVGKDIRATDIGKSLIKTLPESVSQPDMTAHWEAQLESISKRELPYGQFMQPMTATLDQLIRHVRSLRFEGLRGLSSKKAASAKKTASKRAAAPSTNNAPSAKTSSKKVASKKRSSAAKSTAKKNSDTSRHSHHNKAPQ